MVRPSFQFGPLTIHLYGIIIAFAIYVGWKIAKARSTLYKIPEQYLDDYLLIIPIATSIIGARIYHVLDYWSYYSTNPVQIIFIAKGGLGIWGAIVGFTLGLYIFAKIKKLNFFTVLDLGAPSFIIGQAIGRFGNFINQEGFGPPTNLPWGVFIDEFHRPANYQNYTTFHPTFFYEAILDAIAFVLLIYFSKLLKKPGQISALYLISYSLIRFMTEFFRIDTWTISNFKISWAISVIVFFLGCIIFSLKIKRG